MFLVPGDICCPAEPAVVTTILGSCVAICLFDRRQRIGGMNHYLLPRCGSAPPSPRYGDVAFTQLLAGMLRLGCSTIDLRAKLFGGASVLPFGAEADTVGAQNVAVALEALHRHGIPMLARRTGGHRGLFLRFHTAVGRVMVREVETGDSVAARRFAGPDRPGCNDQNNTSAASSAGCSGSGPKRACTARSRAMV